MKKTYSERKAELVNEAIDWQAWLSENSVSYEGLAIATSYFYKMGKRYGLLTEFRENAIC